MNVGDEVLVRKKAFDGKHKIQDRCEEEVYTTIEQLRLDIPVFRVRSSDRIRTLHRNLLFLVNKSSEVEKVVDEPAGDGADEAEETGKTGKYEKVQPEKVDAGSDGKKTECDVTGEGSDDSDGEDGYGVVHVTRWNGDAHCPSAESQVQSDYKPQIVKRTTVRCSVDRVSESVNAPEINDDAGENTDIDTRNISINYESSDSVLQVGQEARQLQVEGRDSDDPGDVDQQTDDYELTRVDEKYPTEDDATGQAEINVTTEKDPEPSLERQDQRPTPQPRRSARERRPPKRFDEYHLYQMNVRSVDSRLHTVNTLMESGVLANIDADTTHRMLAAIFQK